MMVGSLCAVLGLVRSVCECNVIYVISLIHVHENFFVISVSRELTLLSAVLVDHGCVWCLLVNADGSGSRFG